MSQIKVLVCLVFSKAFPPWLANSLLLAMSSHGLFFGGLSSSYKDTSPNMPIFTISFINLNYFFEGLISKYSHIRG